MTKKLLTICTITLLLFITRCADKSKEKLLGVWQVTEVNMNGTSMDAGSIGNWWWEFNDEGGYMINLGGVKEKGRYKVSGEELHMQSVTIPDRPETVYHITKIDSVSMQLDGSTGSNKTILNLVRMKPGEGGEED